MEMPTPDKDSEAMCAFAELEVARLSTDGNLQDLKFPQVGGHGNSIQLSGNTLRQHGRNGSLSSSCVFWGCSLVALSQKHTW